MPIEHATAQTEMQSLDYFKLNAILNVHQAFLEGKAHAVPADFRACSFFGAQLGEIDLRKSNFSQSDFKRANFSGSDLSGVDCSGANFKRSIFEKANLENINLRSAGLIGCNFTRSNLKGADLTGAIITDADFSLAIFDERTKWPVQFDASQFELIFHNDSLTA